MSSDDYEDEGAFHEDMEEDERQVNRAAESDDFASFDANRYLRQRQARTGRPYLDEEPEEIEFDRRRAGRGDEGATSPRAQQAGTMRGGRRRFTPTREGGQQAQGILELLLGILLEPGMRTILLSLGCFLVLCLAGSCGLLFFLLRR